MDRRKTGLPVIPRIRRATQHSNVTEMLEEWKAAVWEQESPRGKQAERVYRGKRKRKEKP